MAKTRGKFSPVGVGVLVTRVRHVLLFLDVGPKDLPVEPGVFDLHLKQFTQAGERGNLRQDTGGYHLSFRSGFILGCGASSR